MTDLSAYEAAARWYCEQKGVDPDHYGWMPKGGCDVRQFYWQQVAEQLRDHDLMSRALEHGRGSHLGFMTATEINQRNASGGRPKP
jgi:hypothetical protein